MDACKKRERCANFTSAEKKLLLQLSNKYKTILENKKTDGVTWRNKEDSWTKIENQFNASALGQVIPKINPIFLLFLIKLKYFFVISASYSKAAKI